NLRFSTHICGASLVSDRYLLTAAHCVTGHRRSFSISLGREDLKENQRSVRNEYAIQDVYIHPAFRSTTPKNRYNDIAILKTDRKVQYNDKIWPFCLPDRNQVYNDFMSVYIAGWGKVNQAHKSPTLQVARVNLVENSRC
ncbi:unnamed protein product, partial [Meganyctiphanes norvegica]